MADEKVEIMQAVRQYVDAVGRLDKDATWKMLCSEDQKNIGAHVNQSQLLQSAIMGWSGLSEALPEYLWSRALRDQQELFGTPIDYSVGEPEIHQTNAPTATVPIAFTYPDLPRQFVVRLNMIKETSDDHEYWRVNLRYEVPSNAENA